MSGKRDPSNRVMLTRVVRDVCINTPWLSNIGLYETEIVSAISEYYELRELPVPNLSCIVRTAYNVRGDGGQKRRQTRNH